MSPCPDRAGEAGFGHADRAAGRDGLLSGETEGHVGSPDTEREHVGQRSLNLKRRGERLDGEIIAWRKASWNMTILPYRVDLRREPAGVSSR